jgi:hypothetical protein
MALAIVAALTAFGGISYAMGYRTGWRSRQRATGARR